MLQVMCSVKVVDEQSPMAGQAGAVVGNEGGLAQVKMDSDNQVHEFRAEQLKQL
jgi:hypothetical protein